MLERFEQIVHSTAKALNCKVEIELKRISPAVINEEEITKSVYAAAQAVFPDTAIDTDNYLTMGAEDMAFMLEKVPGCYFFVGSANDEKGLNYDHHHSKFDIDEDALPRAAALMAAAATEILK